jgi:membrane-bound lytic murein transglycosylase MltF
MDRHAGRDQERRERLESLTAPPRQTMDKAPAAASEPVRLALILARTVWYVRRAPRKSLKIAAIALLASAPLCPRAAQPAQPATPAQPARETDVIRSLETLRWTGDLDALMGRRLIRVLLVYSKTFYFVDRGRQRGATYDFVRAFDEDLNKRLGTGHLRVQFVFIPVARDKLIPGLVEGRGDIAAANLTITDERREQVDFSDPIGTGVDEIVVTGPASPPIQGVQDLAGQEVFVRQSSSYYESLVRVNAELQQAGKSAVRLKLAPETLEDEDLLEMVNAGLVRLVVVDSHKAEFWAQIFPQIRLHPEAAVRTGGAIGWAFRKGSPKLQEAVNRFIAANKKGTLLGNQIFNKYLKSAKYVKNSLDPRERAKYERTIALFRKYGDRYGFDSLMLAAQGYQESQLDNTRRSHAGAVGVMQVLPTTGKELQVGDIHQLDPNIHAGVKYLRVMTDRYFKDAPMTPIDRMLFAFASYNAGPDRIALLRKEAKGTGLDPDVWFNNVERIAARRIGRETVQYVSNIFKYYVAYTLLEDERQERERAKQHKPAG